MRFLTQYSATPLRIPPSCHTLSSFWMASMSVMRAGFFDLTNGDVAETDRLDQAFALERSQRAHARGQRRSRIDDVQLIEVDRVHAERPTTALACRGEMLRPPVRLPAPFRPGDAALGRNRDPRSITRHDFSARAISRSLCPVSDSFQQ